VSRWDQYFCEVDGSTASFVLDLDLHERAPIKNRPYVLRIRIRMIDPREDGLSSDEEAVTLGEIESALESAVGEHALLAGRYTVNKVRTLIFYCDDESRVDLVAPVFRDLYPFHKHTAFVQEDAEWSAYFEFLYPDVLTLRSMLNRSQCAGLGELPTGPVEIVHRFENVDAGFMVEAVARGFRENSGSEIARADVLDPETIDLLTHPLVKLAAEYGGEYTGWTVPVLESTQSNS
jgi:hypothetical protein